MVDLKSIPFAAEREMDLSFSMLDGPKALDPVYRAHLDKTIILCILRTQTINASLPKLNSQYLRLRC